MKIETDVHNSLYAFTSAEGGKNGGCSVNGGDLPPIAQDGEPSSIARPERQLTPPGCFGGCGPSSSADNNNSPANLPKSDFDCEHFQYIDEDVSEEEEDVPATATSTGQHPPAETAAPETRSPPVLSNGAAAPPGSHLTSDHPRVDPQGEVSGHAMPREDTKEASGKKGQAVKRQVSFDLPAEVKTNGTKELKSVLKKGNRSGRSQRGRVTFDEAVTLYSDENEHVQLLALTTGPDIIYTEVFYMFEPPIEYQDVPPFDPPAEYRDTDELPGKHEPVEDIPAPTAVKLQTDVVSEKPAEVVCVPEEPCVVDTPVLEEDSGDVAVSTETEPIDSSASEPKIEDAPSEQLPVESSTKESDKLFERFSEAEREFAVDEELNSVFRELNSEFGTDCTNGDISEDYFRSLLTCLTAAEIGIPVSECDFFSSSKFDLALDNSRLETGEDDVSKPHSRTISEADSDCSISSQDTIIVRYGEDDADQCADAGNIVDKLENLQQASSFEDAVSLSEKQEDRDDVFNDCLLELAAEEEKPRPFPRDSLLNKCTQGPQVPVKPADKPNDESLSRQSSGEQSVNSANSQDPPQDADDSTSSDSRSGEVEEEIRLDDIGYDEEDAEDYDEESFRGMAHGNSKIRRIIKKNALQCTLFRGIEAKRRQQPSVKYPRPKSPLLSQESLVEKLKWLTTIDEQKDNDGPMNFHSKPPDVILSTGGVPTNGSMPHSVSTENDIVSQSYQQPQLYHRVAMPPNTKGGYYVRHDGYPPTHHPSLPRQRASCSGGHPSQMMPHTLPYPPNRTVVHPSSAQMQQWSEQQRNNASMTVPRNFRDWRVIQRVMVSRGGDDHSRTSQIPADYVRCSNGSVPGYPCSVPPDVSRTSQHPPNGNSDELAQFVEQDTSRTERIRKRYSVAEEDDDPTFGFARRPLVRGVQSRIQPNPSETAQGHGTNKTDPYHIFEDPGKGPPPLHPKPTAYIADQLRSWNRDPNWRHENGPGQHYDSQHGRLQPPPMHIHRASVALTELPGNATIPYAHRKPHLDTRYHSYAESMYGSSRTLPTKGWHPADPRTCRNVSNLSAAHHALQLSSGVPMPVSPPMLQVPPHPVTMKDERGVPEGASSSPKISSDSLYHAPVPDSIATGGTHKEEGVIYYSLNV